MKKLHKEILGLMGKIDIDCWDEKDLIVVDLSGQFDVYNSSDIQKLIDAYMQRGYKKFAVNLEEATYLDSSTISAFIHCHRVVEQASGIFMLAGLHGAPREVFEMAKLHNVFSIYLDLTAALDSQLD